MICFWCEEAILPGDEMDDEKGAIPFHYECGFRTVAGSVAHIEGRCSCYVPGSRENDPPDVSRREAARLALATFHRVKAVN